MSLEIIKSKLLEKRINANELFGIVLADGSKVDVYRNSIVELHKNYFFIGREGLDKFLYIFVENGINLAEKFEGIILSSDESYTQKKCYLNTRNRKVIQMIFDFTRPIVIGLKNSFGFGDRLGVANAGHIRSMDITDFKPILTQQSIREMTRTERTAEEVMDCAVWAAFQEGYKDGFGADADHLKTPADIDVTLNAGYKMFTFDPGEHVDNEADSYSKEKLEEVVAGLNWSELEDTLEAAKERYSNKQYKISDDFTLSVNEMDCLRAYAKYGKAVAHIKKMFRYLQEKSAANPFEVEVSVDETESVTSLFEHFFFANELNRLKVEFVSLAPRFVGAFEKGIDYIGDLEFFKAEYIKHLAITKYFGHYKISLHSGSDKFSVYKVIGSLKGAYTHVKTAGTSYLEAVKVTALKQPELFRRIFNFALGLYETEKVSYHVSADITKLKNANQYTDAELVGLFDSNDARQVMHVTFGKVLTTKKEDGSYLFKDELMHCLKVNEDTHYEVLIKHFHKHLEPFN